MNIKTECHKLMDLIWLNDKAPAYNFLKQKMGKPIHFRETNDYSELFKARFFLQKEAIKRNLINIEELNDFFRTL